ncbi:MAG: hypothetical protein ABI151_09005 [Chitinophagaceae bacterium]
MKIFLFGAVLLIGFYSAANAQTEKGNWHVGGSFELNTAKKNTIIGLSPTVGYFVAKNLSAGAVLNLAYQQYGTASSTSFGIGPFARYYFGTLNFRPFLDTEVSFQSNAGNTGGEYFLGGGLAAFINRNVAVEALAGYRHTAYKDELGSGGLNLKIGFMVYISRGEVVGMTR